MVILLLFYWVVFSSLRSFLPQFKESCELMEQEIKTTGVNNYCLEELVTSESDSSESDSSSNSASDSPMSKDNSNPVVEMVGLLYFYHLRNLLWLLWKLWI